VTQKGGTYDEALLGSAHAVAAALWVLEEAGVPMSASSSI